MSTSIKQLETCPLVISSEVLELGNQLDFIVDSEQKKRISERLTRVKICRILYKVNKLNVVGFVAFPINAKKLPCIITLRGGSNDLGMIGTRFILREMAYYADRGYVVVSTQYPGIDGGTGKDEMGGVDDLQSIKNLKKILEWIPEADTSLIAVMGHSRGGLMAYMMLREVKWIKAAVIGGAPTDQFLSAKERKDWREHQISMFGKSKKELLRRSPIKWAKDLPKKTPILIMHGSSDWRVWSQQSIRICLELCKYKIPHRFILFEGADHGVNEFIREYEDQTLDWLKKYLKKDRVLPNMKLHGE